MNDFLPIWSSENDDQLICQHIRAETHDVKTFVFKGVSTDGAARQFKYLAGQFGTFEFNINGTKINRCYTWSSSPTRPELISITVKRVPNGVVSNWLHDHLKVGDTIEALGPSGEFTCFNRPLDAQATAQYLFISGGSGVTPLMSMARTLHDSASTADIVFLHCARTPADVIFAKELALMAHNMPNFRVALVVDAIEQQEWTGLVGRININMLTSIAPDIMTRQVYTCGPAPFMHAVKNNLQNANYPMAQYFEESFSFEKLNASGIEVAQTDEADASDTNSFKIELSLQNKTLEADSQKTILQTALDAGLRWPHSCAHGVCGTCKTKKLSGEVDMQHNGGIRPREIREGWILPCCSKPLTNLTLEA